MKITFLALLLPLLAVTSTVPVLPAKPPLTV
jgi:hypothetical protein